MTAPVRIPLVDGVHDVTYWAVDKHGNPETPKHALVGIDRTSAISTARGRRVSVRTYDLYAYLNKRHASGSYPARIRIWRLKSGTWVPYASPKARAYSWSGGSRVVARYRFPAKGTWLIRAYHSDGLHMPMLSMARKITVY